MKNLKLTLKDQKKILQKNILANDLKRASYDRLRVRNVQATASLATAEQKLSDANTMLRNVKEFSSTISASCNLKSKRYSSNNKERVKTIRLTDELIVAIEAAINGGGESDFPSELLSVEKELEAFEGKKSYHGLGFGDKAKKSMVMPGKQCIYIVKAGDFVQSIAQKFNVPAVKYLRDANLNLENLFDDQHLKIVYPPVGTYIVIPRKFIVTSGLKQLCNKIQPAVENNTMPLNHYEIPEEEAEKSEAGDEKSLQKENPFCHSNVVNKNNAN